MAAEADPLALRLFVAAALGGRGADAAASAQQALVVSHTGALAAAANAAAVSLGTPREGNGAGLPVHDWLEWEEGVLRPAVVAVHADLAGATARLEQAASRGGFLTGSEPSVADAAVFATLHPLPEPHKGRLGPATQQYLARLAQLPAFQRGLADAAAAAGGSAGGAAPPKLPIKGQRNLLITSALPYVNNVPHLGNIIGSTLSADCYARFARSRGINCVYVCGTDEYGTATETKALEEGLSCQEICDKYHAIHREIYQWFDISFDRFGRTPTWQQTQICQEIFRDLQAAGCVLEDTIEQLFSEALGKFLADRFVLGTCPKCGYEDAKGDQCDKCSSMLNPTDLLRPRCKVTGTTPVLRATRHLFLDLPALTPQLQAWIRATSERGGWSANCVATTRSWMRDGLKPRCISRDLQWGTPIPFEGYTDKVFYVWFDAPIGYVSITANYTVDWKAWWQNPEEVELVQFMGKDNVPFHTIIFPATQLGTGRRWTQMRSISVTEYLTYEGGKFSKSRGTGVFGDDARDTGIPAEVWRYYLLSNRPEVSDTDFKWADMRARLNNELLANLGNFVNRALVFTANKFGGVTPPALAAVLDARGGGAPDEPPAVAAARASLAALNADVAELVGQYVGAMDAIKLRDGIKIAMAVSGRGNKFLQDHKPWELLKGGDAERAVCGTIIAAALGLALLLAALIEPFMPSITAKIVQQLALPASDARLSDSFLAAASAQLAGLVPPGHAIGKPEVLFREISPEIEERLRARFGGDVGEGAAVPAGKAAGKAAPAGKAAAAAGGKAAKGQEAGKGKAAKAPAQPASTGLAAVDLRVGLIIAARRHENAETLYVEDIECGEAAPRQVVSGLVKHIPLEQMQGRRVVIVANLKAGNMRGVRSQAMVLAASSADGSRVELVEPPAGAAPGTRVTAPGHEGEPVAVLKKDAFDAVAPQLRTDGQLRACFAGVPLQTPEGPCTVASIADGAVR